MKIEAFGITKEFKENITLLDILKEFKPNDYKNYIICNVSNDLKELTKKINKDSKIEFYDLSNRDAMYVYQSTLRLIFSYAVYELYKCNVSFHYSVSRSIFCKINNLGKTIDFKILNEIRNKMDEIIEKDIPIIKHKVTSEQAKEIYLKEGLTSKINLLDYRISKTTNVYEINGYYNYMFNYLLPSTGFIKDYRLNLYSPGIIMQYPRAELNGNIPDFSNEVVLGKYIVDAYKWNKITKTPYLSDLNKIIDENNYKELINLCETRHNNMIAQLGENISKDIENIKLIAVAGPSSSGKTTFTNRLRIELISRGITPLMISLDNYYNITENSPKNSDGTFDYEHIEALDLKLFNEQMISLISGEEVSLPIYDFVHKKREFGPLVKLGLNQPILIEGIHALNDRLTEAIPANNKYKIYIAPHAQVYLDQENPVSMTDIRLIRRLVRDYHYRDPDPIKTIQMWPMVRKGEFEWIYKFQEQANFVFNSALTYELAVLKNKAIKILSTIPKDKPEYILAKKLLNILKYVNEIPEKWVPCNSILREFIGGSIFYED